MLEVVVPIVVAVLSFAGTALGLYELRKAEVKAEMKEFSNLAYEMAEGTDAE